MQLQPMVRCVLILFAIPLLAAGQESTSPPVSNRPVPNGIYLIERWTTEGRDLLPLYDGEIAIRHDPRLVNPDSDQAVITLTIRTNKAVLLDGLRELTPTEHSDGRIRLNATLPEDQSRHLEEMSRKYLGRQVAIVIDGKAWTTHKIRTVIRGGRMQIMRCTDEGCRVVLEQLGKPGSPSRDEGPEDSEQP